MLKRFVLFLLPLATLYPAEPMANYGNCKMEPPGATRLKIIETTIEVKGKSSPVYQVVLDNGAEYLTKKQGECFNVIVENHTSVPTGLHWHGLILPTLEDGVPYITQPPILPSTPYSYQFQLVQTGSYFAHSHYGLQEQKLMTLPIVLLPEENSPIKEIVATFEDFSFQSLEAIWQGLRKNYMKKKGTEKPPLSAPMTNSTPDLNDVQYDAYLTNRRTLENPPVYQVNPGEQVRLRLMNASTASSFLIALGGLSGTLVAVDGNEIEPIHFPLYSLTTAQRIDLLVTIPKQGGAFPILAQGQGTNMVTGLVLQTPGAPLPKLPMEIPQTIGAIDNTFEKQLKAKFPLSPKPVDRTLTVALQGNMQDYVWAINDHIWPDIDPLLVNEGERVEILFINQTAMAHPMHLHGHLFQIVEIDGQRFAGAVRDTVLVMPHQQVRVQFDANNPGIWPLHCHIAYHLWGGMLTVVKYARYTPPYFAPSTIQDYSQTYGGY